LGIGSWWFAKARVGMRSRKNSFMSVVPTCEPVIRSVDVRVVASLTMERTSLCSTTAHVDVVPPTFLLNNLTPLNPTVVYFLIVPDDVHFFD
jgi:hypothetical protein